MRIYEHEIGHCHLPGNQICHIIVGDTVVSKYRRRDYEEGSDCRQIDCGFIPHVRSPLGEIPLLVATSNPTSRDTVSSFTPRRNESLTSDLHRTLRLRPAQ